MSFVPSAYILAVFSKGQQVIYALLGKVLDLCEPSSTAGRTATDLRIVKAVEPYLGRSYIVHIWTNYYTHRFHHLQNSRLDLKIVSCKVIIVLKSQIIFHTIYVDIIKCANILECENMPRKFQVVWKNSKYKAVL